MEKEVIEKLCRLKAKIAVLEERAKETLKKSAKKKDDDVVAELFPIMLEAETLRRQVEDIEYDAFVKANNAL